ncbi:hypothetical protein E2C01_017746 [Portunus trituberculatus]|uniref:Uncharacterized protein n=1 Tax=Portunus trituberculatus TaxID=210409 RepID=A0A5B7DTC7_PORTR|nr:hypothetical protein [Portunus trituberculatus]
MKTRVLSLAGVGLGVGKEYKRNPWCRAACSLSITHWRAFCCSPPALGTMMRYQILSRDDIAAISTLHKAGHSTQLSLTRRMSVSVKFNDT